ncbi:MAG: phosphatase PAP2 family protein [Alphaproteobacteria bacterium]|nr:phosphatase PAP2 family protein [Alphaproteobacteria bacterium]
MARPSWRNPWVLAWLAIICVMTVTIDGPIATWADGIDRKYWPTFRDFAETGDAKRWLVPLAGLGILFFLCYLVDPATKRARIVGWFAGFFGFCFAAIAYSGLVVTFIKIIVGRARPNAVDTVNWPIFDPFTFKYAYHSFPSGHGNTVFVVAMIVGLLVPRIRTPMLILAAALAFCRVLQYRHFVSDSVGGALLAVITTLWLQRVFAKREAIFRYRHDGAITFTAPGRLIARRLKRLLPGRSTKPAPATA